MWSCELRETVHGRSSGVSNSSRRFRGRLFVVRRTSSTDGSSERLNPINQTYEKSKHKSSLRNFHLGEPIRGRTLIDSLAEKILEFARTDWTILFAEEKLLNHESLVAISNSKAKKLQISEDLEFYRSSIVEEVTAAIVAQLCFDPFETNGVVFSLYISFTIFFFFFFQNDFRDILLERKERRGRRRQWRIWWWDYQAPAWGASPFRLLHQTVTLELSL